MSQMPSTPSSAARFLAFLRCLAFGHDPDLEQLDWVGRPISCLRCGCYDSDMGWRAYEQFCGRAAIAAWNAQAIRMFEETHGG